MVFHSPEFLIFFSIVFILYLFLKREQQNLMLLIASYVFYGYWDWRFLSLMLVTTVLDYCCGLQMAKAKENHARKFFLCLSMVGNLGILAFFKYSNFFATNIYRVFDLFGWHTSPAFLAVVLPVGISFYTFQSMSYTIDVYRRRTPVVTNFLDYANFVAFFPSLVAGPIERPQDLLPQVDKPRPVTWENISRGTAIFLWGLFLKVYIADNLAGLVDPTFSKAGPYNGAEILISLYAFSFQIFCDFAGYSIMAQGIGKFLGFDIMDNFKQPYFTSNPSQFWQEWHISLSTWLRDYLYIPLGGNRGNRFLTYRNLMITMVLGGLWHGADWTFIVWGTYHGMLLCGYRLLNQSKEPREDGRWVKIFKVIGFFHLICFSWIFFRAQSMTQAWQMVHGLLFEFNLVQFPAFEFRLVEILVLISPLLLVQYFQRRYQDLFIIFRWPWFARGTLYFALLFLVVSLGVFGGKEFIYFQF